MADEFPTALELLRCGREIIAKQPDNGHMFGFVAFENEVLNHGDPCKVYGVCAIGAINRCLPGYDMGLDLGTGSTFSRLQDAHAIDPESPESITVAALFQAIPESDRVSGWTSAIDNYERSRVVQKFNDWPGRTQAQLVELFDRAIELVETDQVG